MLSFIGNQFKKPSGFWGKVISFLMKKGNKPAYDRIIQELELQPGDRLLEIGYGHGIGLETICSTYDCKAVGIDFSELMYQEARKRNQIHIANNKLELHFGNYLQFECPQESFDKIFLINVIYFWENLEIPFKKILEELKPDGTLCIFMAHADDLKKLKFTLDEIFNKYTIEWVSETLKKTGFQEIKYTFHQGYYIKCRK